MKEEKEEEGLGVMICNWEDVASTIDNDDRKSSINVFFAKIQFNKNLGIKT